MLLINRYILSSSIDFGSGCVNHPDIPILFSSLTDIQRTFYISFNIGIGCYIGVWNCNKCCQMKNQVNSFCNFLAEMWITYIAGNNLEVFIGWNFFKPAPIIEGIVLRKCFDAVSFSK